MLRTNTAADVANTGVVKIDAGEGVALQVPVTPAAGATWATLPGKPIVFPPDVHTHTQAQVTGLVDALAGKRTIAPMVIGEGVNLNDVTTPGEHSQQFTAWATRALNYPSPSEDVSPVAGRLFVGANTTRSQVTQFYIPFTTTKLDIYTRNFYTTWGSWERISMASDLALKADANHPMLYDSGWRDVTSSLGSAVASDSTGKFYLRRRAGMVLVRFENVKLAGGGTTNIAWSSLPVGFQSVGAGGGGEMFQVGTATRSGGTAYIMPDGAHLRLQGVRPTAWESPVTEVPAGHIVNGAFSFATADPVPTTLPGTPA